MRIASTLALLAILITGCASAGSDRPGEDATLLLDAPPDAVHAGIYLATERGYDEAEGVQLEVERPGRSADAPARLRDGRADLAVMDIHDLAAARARGAKVVGVAALVQDTLGARARGARPRRSKAGEPPHPELVLVTSRLTLQDRQPLVRATIRALQRGYAQAQAEPDSAVAAVQQAAPRADRQALAAQLDAVSPAFTAGARAPGELIEPVLRRWAAAEGVNLDETFDFGQVGPIRNP